MKRTLLSIASLLLLAALAVPSHAQATLAAPRSATAAPAAHHVRASHEHRRRHGGIERMDANRDGRISRAEFDAAIALHPSRRRQGDDHRAPDFAAIDRNHDGYVVASEVHAYRERMRPQREALRQARFDARFTRADLDHDGRLGHVEVSEKSPWLERRFAWLDENRDGFLSRSELLVARRDGH